MRFDQFIARNRLQLRELRFEFLATFNVFLLLDKSHVPTIIEAVNDAFDLVDAFTQVFLTDQLADRICSSFFVFIGQMQFAEKAADLLFDVIRLHAFLRAAIRPINLTGATIVAASLDGFLRAHASIAVTTVQDAGEWIGHHIAYGRAATGGETADMLAAVKQFQRDKCRMFARKPFALN